MLRLAFASVMLASAAPLFAQTAITMDFPPPSINNTNGTLPHMDMATAGGGMVLPNSKADVSAARLKPDIAAQIEATVEGRRAEALKIADRVKAGAVVPPELTEKIRAELDTDIKLWRQQYGVGAKAHADMRAKWVREAAMLSPAEWVLWRAAWYDERAKWVAARTR